MSGSDDVQALVLELKQFAEQRNWEQFHSPKNLSMALAVEAAELLEHFQWETEQASSQLEPKQKELVGYEIADIFIYLLRICERLDIDLMSVTKDKIAINHQRYPVDKVKGSSKKYTEY
ncbi:MAG: nucleotide pyrophosphohydrolase [Pseudomonadota bacterium]